MSGNYRCVYHKNKYKGWQHFKMYDDDKQSTETQCILKHDSTDRE